MDKQLREDIQKILKDNLMVCGVNKDSDGVTYEEYYQIKDRCLLDELESYINDNYVSKEKVRGLKMKEWKTEPHMTRDYTMRDLEIDTHNNAVKEINTAIDTLVSVPTPESEKE